VIEHTRGIGPERDARALIDQLLGALVHRGIAAAVMLGAVGVNLGTRFLASNEATIEGEWKQAIVAANSEDTVKIDFLNDIMPLPGTGGYGTVLRLLRTPFVIGGAASARRSLKFGSAYPRNSQRAQEAVAATTQFSPAPRLPGASKR